MLSVPGDDGPFQPPERSGVWKTKAAGTGEEALPGKPVAKGWTGQHPAEAAEEWAERRPAGGGEEAPRVHEPAEKIWWRCLSHSKYCTLIN